MLSNLSKVLFKNNQLKSLTALQANSINYKADDLWKSVLSVSNQGSKKGRGKRRGKVKDLNIGQNIGDGKMQVSWPGLNTEVYRRSEISSIKVIGVDENREKKLTEIRNKMDKFRKISIPPHERGFTGSSLAGKSIGEPLSYDDVNFEGFDTRIIQYKVMISHKSILGKKKTVSCFVITGNGNGIIGYGHGKGSSSMGAIKLAKLRASHHLLYIDRYEDRTLFHNFYEEYYLTKLYAEKMPNGYGLVCHRILKKVCQAVGIKDLYAKLEGSKNAQNMVKAFLCGLLNQKKYDDIAEQKGMNVVEFKPEMNYFPLVLGKPKHQSSEKDQELSNLRRETDLDLYLFGNKYRLEKKKKKPFYADFHSYKMFCKQRDIDRAQRKSRNERMKYLTEDGLNKHRYPLKPKPKNEESAEAS